MHFAIHSYDAGDHGDQNRLPWTLCSICSRRCTCLVSRCESRNICPRLASLSIFPTTTTTTTLPLSLSLSFPSSFSGRNTLLAKLSLSLILIEVNFCNFVTLLMARVQGLSFHRSLVIKDEWSVRIEKSKWKVSSYSFSRHTDICLPSVHPFCLFFPSTFPSPLPLFFNWIGKDCFACVLCHNSERCTPVTVAVRV